MPRSTSLPPVVLWRRAVLAAPELNHAAKLVACALAEHMDADGGSCYPSVTTLAGETAQDRRTVQRALRALEASGWITRAEGRGRGHSSRYAAARPPAGKAAAVPPFGEEEGRHVVQQKAARRARKGGGSTARGSQEEAREAVPPVAPQGGPQHRDADALRRRRAALDAAGRAFEPVEEVRRA